MRWYQRVLNANVPAWGGPWERPQPPSDPSRGIRESGSESVREEIVELLPLLKHFCFKNPEEPERKCESGSVLAAARPPVGGDHGRARLTPEVTSALPLLPDETLC